jgi:xanthine dehydrogenase YagR molybdenum-binding subunit
MRQSGPSTGWLRARVTGSARYTVEIAVENLTHAALVLSTIPRGRVLRSDSARARSVSGFID